jgi:SAM-dependent methyltransferase
MENSRSKISALLNSLLGNGSWELRNEALLDYYTSVIQAKAPLAKLILDLGAGDGVLSSMLQKRTNIDVISFEPFVPKTVQKAADFLNGYAHIIPIKDKSIDVVLMSSVYEHIPPNKREKTFLEIYRILKPKGLLMGEMPNMYFPIEIHSQLPLQQFLPYSIGDAYFRAFSHEIWRSGHQDWFRVSPKQLINDTQKAAFRKGLIYGFEYPIECIPRSLRFANRLLKVFPIAYVFQILK